MRRTRVVWSQQAPDERVSVISGGDNFLYDFKDVDEQRQSFIGATTVAFHESWPAYQLSKDSVIRVALQNAAKHHLHSDLTAKVTGPSNIGNYLAKLGIDATAGLGVRYEGLHATNERIDLATIPAVQATYHEAHLRLFSGQ